MKELDLLLGRWLEQRWPGADDSRRRDFEWLLEQPDPDLADWLIGGGRPAGRTRAALVDDIVRRPA
jgi:succinate dehydrogenase flavin-adding protein (antitoxin of CptAB toxin-antitoxin module)